MASARSLLVVGSVPLSSSEDVFRFLSKEIGDLVGQIPDGETGERSNFIIWAADRLKHAKGIEIDSDYVSPVWPSRKTVRAAQGIAAEQIDFGANIYADAALKSYSDFRRLRSQGVIPAHVRFQVSRPTALGVIFTHTTPFSRRVIWDAYERHLIGDVRKIVQNIPHLDLAIQWDIAPEIHQILEHAENARKYSIEDIVASVAKLTAPISEAVSLGIHLCYGDPGHKHVLEPKDTGVMVHVSNHLSSGIGRLINWIHMPVPRGRHDDQYFAPMKQLRLRPKTLIYLGLIHNTDGLEGAKRRIAAAKRAVKDFGVATECGFGRRPVGTLPDLLRLHREVALLIPK